MRIGVDIRELEKGTMTGTGRYLYNLLEYVAKSDRVNEYILFGNQKTECPIRGERVKIKIIPESLALLWDQLILLWQIKKEGIGLFYSPYDKIPVLSSAKLIITIHDTFPFAQELHPGIRAPILRMRYWLMARRATAIFVVSQYSKEAVERCLKIPPDKVRVVYDCVGDRFKPYPQEECLRVLRKRFPLEKDFILYVGNLRPHKNLSKLIEAYDLLGPGLKDRYQLIICGKKDKFYARLQAHVKAKGLEANVVFTDFVEDEVLPYLYSCASAFVFPSLYEGFGLPVLEAMACETAVIASDISPLKEVVAEAAVLVDPNSHQKIAEGITRVLSDDNLRADLAKKGLARSRYFTPQKAAEQMREVFNLPLT